ncbi:MAG: hypothetical protein DRQ63_11410, partial [Gammaproteobacteria bacterium]
MNAAVKNIYGNHIALPIAGARRAGWTAAALVALTIHGGAHAASAGGVELRALESQMIEALTAGDDVRALTRELVRKGQGRARTALPPSSRVAVDASLALDAYRGALTRLRDAGVSAAALTQLGNVHRRWQAADLLFDAHLADVETSIATRGSALLGRQQAFRAAYDEVVKRTVESLTSVLQQVHAERNLATLADDFVFLTGLRWRLWRMGDALEAPPEGDDLRILRNSALPFRAADVARREPKLEPAVVPSYELIDESLSAPTIEDRSASSHARLSQEIMGT